MTTLANSSSHGVLWLDDPAAADSTRVGGKAAHLSRLAADFPVPTGFCLPASALYAFLTHDAGIEALQTALRDAYDRLEQVTGEERPRVAVRSSAIDEDGQAASFAGQHETYLNLANTDEILAAIVRCWESGQSSRAQAYRHRHGLELDRLNLAVLVQQLVLADVAIVAFSANPVTGARDQGVVTASYGLGESLVGGTVTPDTWIVEKASGAIISQQIGPKERMTIMAPGGTSEVLVPRVLRGLPSLNPEQVSEVVDVARRLEERQGWPVDIECAYARGQLYLLQCRPITSDLSLPA